MLIPLVNFRSHQFASRYAALALVALLGACGGGSGSHHPAPPPAPPLVSYDVVPLIDDPAALIRVTPRGINQFDMVAGIIFHPDGPSRAFLHNGTRLIDLGDFGGAHSQAFAINRCGHVAGWALGPQGDIPQAFLYDGKLKNIGTPGIYSQANALSDCDKVVGGANFGGQTHAFLYDGKMHDLGTLGGNSSEALDINNAGLVVGNSLLRGGAVLRAFIYDSKAGGGLRDLGSLGGNETFMRAINQSGQTAGASTTAELARRAVRYSAGTLQNLGTLDGDDGFASEAFEINDAGFVVGISTGFDNVQRGFVHDGVTMHEVRLPASRFSEALAINAAGMAVGSSLQLGSAQPRAISWTLDEGTVDLNTRLHAPPPGLVVLRALAINDRGSIVATSNTGLVLLKRRP